MNLIFISIDSLNRHFLPAYGQPIELAVATPNLDRFAARSAVFDRHYAGSLPCMPARREFFSGYQEFLWRPWGPMEPFDVPVALAARRAGTLTQLVTDHYHLFQHGSHGYFEDYHGFEFVRGHETDAWKTAPRDPAAWLLHQIREENPYELAGRSRAVYARNVAGFSTEEDFFAPQVFKAATHWVEENLEHPQWFLSIDSFDVHEPFHCPEPYASMYTDEDPRDPELVCWPRYGRIDAGASLLTERQVAFVRAQFAGKLTMVDRWLGRLLDALDRHGLWDETAVIITTDHGHYLGEHGWMGKPGAPVYNVLAHTPLFIWHPDSPRMGQRIGALTSAVDLYATMLEVLGAAVPAEVHSQSLLPLLMGRQDRHREWALYGYWGSTVNVTDGRHTYLHPTPREPHPLCYSTMMMNPNGWFSPPKPRLEAEAGSFLPYTRTPAWRYPGRAYTRHEKPLLFDVETDPGQEENLAGRAGKTEARLRELMVGALAELEAPAELPRRLGLEA